MFFESEVKAMENFWAGKRVVVTGGAGFLGSGVVRALRRRGVPGELITIPRSRELDLREPENCRRAVEKQNIVIHLAATFGGIDFNRQNPGRVFYDNSAMALHLIDAAWRGGIEKFVGIGSSVEYPASAPLPFSEERLWDGYPEESNSAYALAKRFMLAQSQFYRRQYGFCAIHLMPAKLYGPGMNFDPAEAQVAAALITRIAEAQRDGRDFIEVWGSGRAAREFLFVDDAAEAIVLAAEKYSRPEPVNIGSGREVSIRELAVLLGRLMDFRGQIRWDTSKPEGHLRSVTNVSRAKEAFGFAAATSLEDGLKRTIQWYRREAAAPNL